MSGRPRPPGRPAAEAGGRWRGAAVFVGLGAILGVILLHPATMVIYWLDLQTSQKMAEVGLSELVAGRMSAAFGGSMLAMTGLFAALGSGVGVLFLTVERALRRRAEAITELEATIVQDIPTLIAAGEGERLELKSTARWDLRQQKRNAALQDVIAKAIAGLANHQGGSLIIGVSDDGEVVGLEHDYGTLKHKDRDGFEQFLMTLVSERLGADLCPTLRVVFGRIDDKDVCRVIVNRAPRPVYFRDRKTARYYLRTGNVTRELDVEAAIAHIRAKWDGLADPR